MKNLLKTSSLTAKAALVALAIAATAPVAAQSRDPHFGHNHNGLDVCDLVPQTNLVYPDRGFHPGGMSQRSFQQVIELAQRTYEPIFRHYGLRLAIRGNWRDNTPNAFAYPGQFPFETIVARKLELKDLDTRFRRIDMLGGLARHPLMTVDSLLMVTCHEIGHHIGGLPAKVSEEWAVANEGQSDYFASAKCMRKMLEPFDNVEVVRRMDIDPLARRGCMATHGRDAQAAAICMRTAMAGKALAATLGALGGRGPVAFETPDRSVAPVTDNRHPAAQCRLDTYFQGALCRESHETPMTFENTRDGACVPGRGSNLGLRPACWFNPTLYDRPELVRTRVRR